MGFYQEFSSYYDIIFPPQPAQLKFFEGEFKKNFDDKISILDVACGTGGYSLELGKKGYRVTGVDLESEMIQIAERKLEQMGNDSLKNKIDFHVADMCDLSAYSNQYQGLICLGNSLAHITEEENIKRALQAFYQALDNRGTAIVQVVNFDRILKHKVDSLPTVDEEEAVLVRNYIHRSDGLIDFQTELNIKKEGQQKTYDNTVVLRPILKQELESWCVEAGFKTVTFYGKFDGMEHSDETPATIVVAEKMV